MEPDKNCAKCGRVITFRKKWEKNWDEIKYCSERCRRERKLSGNDDDRLLALLRERGAGRTIDPTEILLESEKLNSIRIEEVRQAARRLANLNQIVIMQKGRIVEPSVFRGPIVLKLK